MEQDFRIKNGEAGRGRFPIAGCKHTIAKELVTGVCSRRKFIKVRCWCTS